MTTLKEQAEELKKATEHYAKVRNDFIRTYNKHWCSTFVDRKSPDYFDSKFGEKLDGGYGYH